jgi:two-component system, NarL family, response regulator DegU
MDKKRILIADDHPIFRSGLRALIDAEASFTVVGEATDGEQALSMIIAERPDVAILDYNMPKLNGFELLKKISERDVDISTVLLTMHNDEAMFSKAFELGVRGYVLKDSASIDIVNCLNAVTQGQVYTSAAVTTYLLKRASRTKAVDGVDSLTPAERKVLRLIADYKTSREIADELSISVRTVENHRSNISGKVGVTGSHALFKFAMQHRSELL